MINKWHKLDKGSRSEREDASRKTMLTMTDETHGLLRIMEMAPCAGFKQS